MLKACSAMLSGGLAEDLRPFLVEALFDYDRKWYGTERSIRPSSWNAASAEARTELRKIGESALREVELTPAQRATVGRELAALGR